MRTPANGNAIDANMTNFITGTYVCNSNSSNFPTSGWYILEVQNLSKDSIVTITQKATQLVSPNASYHRTYHNGAWDDWVRDDNFGCNTLAELKEALANV